MSFVGVIKDGGVVAAEKIALPDGTQVRIEALADGNQKSLAESLREFIGMADDLPTDLARNHDHYLRGTPRK